MKFVSKRKYRYFAGCRKKERTLAERGKTGMLK